MHAGVVVIPFYWNSLQPRMVADRRYLGNGVSALMMRAFNELYVTA